MAEQNDFSVFVGDLSPDVDDALLETTFRTYYPSTRSAKVMLDPVTQRSRGYGFVRFSNEQERDRAMTEMNGVIISTRAIRVSLATARRNPGAGGGSATGTATPGSAGGASTTSSAPGGVIPGEQDPNNTTLFIGGLSPSVTEADLHAAFSRFGDIVYTKIPQGKGCGFVQFVARPAAEVAMQEMTGTMLGGMAIRISWGRSTGKVVPGAGTVGTAHHGAGPHATAAHPYAFPYGAYDPYGGMYAPYMSYDPYSYYQGMDPYSAAYASYGAMAAGMAGYGPGGMAASAAASAAANAHGGSAGSGGPGPVTPVMYDPLAPVNVDKMNMAYMHRQIPMLTGAFMRMPIPMAVPIAPGAHM